MGWASDSGEGPNLLMWSVGGELFNGPKGPKFLSEVRNNFFALFGPLGKIGPKLCPKVSPNPLPQMHSQKQSAHWAVNIVQLEWFIVDLRQLTELQLLTRYKTVDSGNIQVQSIENRLSQLH